MSKKIKELFLDSKIDISNKIYVAFTIATIVAFVGMFIFNLLTDNNYAVTIVTWLMFFVQLINLFYSVYKRRFYVQTLISCILIGCVALPFAFLSGRLFFGSVAMWMVVGYTYTSLVLSKKTRVVVLLIQSLINMTCFILSLGMDWDKALLQYDPASRLSNDWFAVIVGGIIIFGMSSFSRWLASFEQKTIRKQKDDIVALYQNQNKFFSSMSHEIRTPINTVMGLNEVNLSLNPSEDIYDYSTEIKHASKKLLTLINDILDLSKLQSGNMEVVEAKYNLSEMISLITDDVWKESYDKGLKLNIIVDPNIPNELFGDEIRIRQIVRNILSNAINSTERGSVELQIRFDQRSRNEINLIFEIEDTSEGIRREELPYVFDTFRYVEDQTAERPGTGLELPIAKSLSDIMGGRISVDSIYSRGSKYRFSVVQKTLSDVKSVKTLEKAGKRKAYSSFSAASSRVLVVDDDGMNLNVFVRMFSGVFSNIDTATSGEEAVALCTVNDYDMVFIDHLMPGMDGLATLDEIRKVRENILAIALTANSGSDARALYLGAGFTDYLAKPIDREYALRTIYKLLPEEKKDGFGDTDEVEKDTTKEYVETKRLPIIITTDSVADMPEYMLKEQNIPVMPFYVNTSEGMRYKDQVEISSESLISFINNNDRYAFSEPPGESDYEAFFGDALRQADRVIHVATAKNNSPAYANAVAASKSFANVEVIDSGNVSFGLGIMAIDAAKLAASGADASEIKEKILSDKERIVFDFVVDETRNLAATGRIPMTVHRLCSFLNIHPVIRLRDSKLVIRTVKIGDINKIRERYFRKICKKKDISEDFLAFMHSNLDAEIIERVQDKLSESIPADEYLTLLVGPAVASNSGRGAFGICYRKRAADEYLET